MFQFFRVCMLILLMCLGWGCADKQVDPCSLVECGVGFKCIEGRCVSDCPSGMIFSLISTNKVKTTTIFSIKNMKASFFTKFVDEQL